MIDIFTNNINMSHTKANEDLLSRTMNTVLRNLRQKKLEAIGYEV